MRHVANFIDAGHLESLARQYGVREIDIEGLARRLAESEVPRHTYYYDCLPYLADDATEKDHCRYERKHRFLTALSYKPRIEVRLGRLAYRGLDASGCPIVQQKRVDMTAGTDLVYAACKGLITDAALLTSDEDFIPAIERTRDEGVNVHLFHGPSATSALLGVCSSDVIITPAFLQAVAWRPRHAATC